MQCILLVLLGCLLFGDSCEETQEGYGEVLMPSFYLPLLHPQMIIGINLADIGVSHLEVNPSVEIP